jgi:hypothetical protein
VVPYLTLKMSVSKRDIIIRLHERGINPGHELFSQEVRFIVFELLEKNQENVSPALSKDIEDFVKYFQNKTKKFYSTSSRNFKVMMKSNADFFDLPKIFKNLGPDQPPQDQPQPRPHPVRPHPNPMVRLLKQVSNPHFFTQNVRNFFWGRLKCYFFLLFLPFSAIVRSQDN